jgi:DNA-directed RNA polymerase specialized sigma24 family protein
MRRITKRLDVIIKIMLMSYLPDDKIATKIQMLSAAGLRSTEIADILGITPSNVNVRLSMQRKKSAKRP